MRGGCTRALGIAGCLVATIWAAGLTAPAFGGEGRDLYQAVLDGDADKVKKYLEKGQDTGYRSSGRFTPLLAAAKRGHADICRLLIEAGAEIEVHSNGWTALHLAADGGHHEVVAVLLQANPRLDVPLGDYTALDLAIENGHREVVALLKDAGAATRATGQLLFRAASDGDAATVRDLVESGADLHWKRPKNHWTPLHEAAYEGHLEIVNYLVSKGADVADTETNGLTPLMLAAQEGRTEVVRALLDADSPLHHKDDYQMTAIHRSAQSGNKETVLLLLERGAKLDEGAADNTPLFIAAGEGDLELTQLLIDKGADVNYRMDSMAFTALHRAAASGSVEVTELLLKHGAKPNVTNRLGDTPLSVATKKGFDEVAALLRQHGAKAP